MTTCNELSCRECPIPGDTCQILFNFGNALQRLFNRKAVIEMYDLDVDMAFSEYEKALYKE